MSSKSTRYLDCLSSTAAIPREEQAGPERAGPQGPGDSCTACRGTGEGEHSLHSRAAYQALSVLSKEQLCPPHKRGSRLASGTQKSGLPQLHPCLNYRASSTQVCLQTTEIQSVRQHRLSRAALTLAEQHNQHAASLPALLPASSLERPGGRAPLSTASPEQQQLPRPIRTCKPNSACEQPAHPVTNEESKPEPSGRQLS